MSDTASETTPAPTPAPSPTPAPTVAHVEYENGVRDALAIVDEHIGHLANGKELDLTAARKMRADVEALLPTEAV
jgi:hypothetical protein